MDNNSYGALMRNLWHVSGLLRTVDFSELHACAVKLNANPNDLGMIAVLADAARRLPRSHTR
jgi:hypothetical protein